MMWCELENAAVKFLVFTFIIDMIKAEKVFDKEPAEEGATPVSIDNEEVKEWLATDDVKYCKIDMDLTDKFYKLMEEY